MKKYLICKATVFSALAALFFALFFAIIPMLPDPLWAEERTEDAAPLLSADTSEKIVIASAAGTDYKLYFSSDSRSSDRDVANDLSDIIRELYGVRMRANADVIDKATANEILIGDTNRAESKTLLKKIQNSVENPNDLAWGYAVINGKLLYTANCDEAFTKGAEEFIAYLVENDFTLPSNLLVYGYISRADYDKELAEEEEALREERIRELLEINSQFTQKQFGGFPMSMGKSPYASPAIYPPSEHPYMYITRDRIDDALAIMEDPMYSRLVADFWKEVERDDCISGFPRVEYANPNNKYQNENKDGNYYQYDAGILSALQNKAFAYLITGNKVFGYEAIIGIKNAMITLVYSTYIRGDLYHGAANVMMAAAKIYDWCYDLLTEEDKNQIIAGVSHLLAPKLEFDFPPANMNGVSGHGTGLRDYLMIAFSFYSDMPDWWEFVGGRFFEEYVPVINAQMEGGWISQGSACYCQGKFQDIMGMATMLYVATGKIPYEADGIRLGAYYMFSLVQPNGRYFQTGDGTRFATGGEINISYLYDYLVIFDDPVVAGYFYSITSNLNNAADSEGTDMPICKLISYIMHYPAPEAQYSEKLDTVQYFTAPAGSMTARSSWSSDAAAVYMKIGTKTIANHDNLDHGTFQIYYKGLLAGTNGTYNKYGSYHHKYYLQATVSENGILVFNPAYADTAPAWSCGKDTDPEHEHSQLTCTMSNSERYFYSGSQRRRLEPAQQTDQYGNVLWQTLPTLEAFENWLSEEYDTGVITGHDKAYNPDGSPEYGYISGNVALAYSSDTVSYLERRMLTVFTGNPDYPMLFFTFDTIEATDASFGKTFLLHTRKEPAIDEEKLIADIREGEGRLSVQSLYGAQSIAKIGGSGYAYWINGENWENGKNAVDINNKSDHSGTHWGRMELRASGEKETQMLTAMFVTDSSNDETPLFEKFENKSVYGAEFDGIYAVFLKSRERQSSSFSFKTSGKGLSRYYISGIAEGIWTVKVDGIPVATVGVDPEEGFASFIAPSGNVTLEPLNIGTAASVSEESEETESRLAAAPYTEETKISAPEGEALLTWCALPSVSDDKFRVLSKASKHALRKKP